MSSQHKISEPVLSEKHHSVNNEKYVSQIFRTEEKLFINRYFRLKGTVAFDIPKIFSIIFFTKGSMQILKSNRFYCISFFTDAVTKKAGNINIKLKENSNSILKRISCSNNVTG